MHQATSNIWWGSITIVAGLLLLSLHLWQLASLPRGLYLDETSIGINAAGIATSGHDEHGQAWPIYFEAFGEYKNPIYIYATAGLFKLLGVNNFTLRVASPLFLGLALVGIYILAGLLWPDQPHIRLYAMIVLGTLPWFWPMSRIAFETISQLPAWIWLLVVLYKAYEQPTDKYTVWYAAVYGLLAGVSVYTYSTSRLLTFLLISLWGILYIRKRTWRSSLSTLVLFVSALIPYTYFALHNPGALVSRFKVISYVSDNTLSLTQKIQIFVDNYLRQFSPDFLLLHGDHNIRHATGYGGELYYVVAILAFIGLLLALLFQKRYNRWQLFLVLNLLNAPVAAALTTGDTGHSLRTVSEGVFFIILSGYGLLWLLSKTEIQRRAHLIYSTIIIVLIVESSLYLTNYFTKYVSTSAIAFESYNLQAALENAVQQSPERILVTPAVPDIHLAWYQLILPELTKVPILKLSSYAELSHSCLVYALSEMQTMPVGREIPVLSNPPMAASYFRTRCY